MNEKSLFQKICAVSEIVADELLGCVYRQRREVGRVGTHVSDESVLIQFLGNAHCLAHRESELSCRFLLESRSRERSGRGSCAFLLLDATYGKCRTYLSFKEFAR